MEISFCDLKKKEVINIADGKRLGRTIDVVFAVPSGRVCGIVVPGDNNFRLFKGEKKKNRAPVRRPGPS